MIIRASLASLWSGSGHADRAARGAGRHRRGDQAPEPDRHRGARFLEADPVRAWRNAGQRRLPRLVDGGVGREQRAAGGARSRPTHSAGDDRRRAASHGARQHPDERAPCGRKHVGSGRTRPRLRQPSVVLSTRRHEDRIAVTVRDRGTGIAPEDMAHIFDPFFTTRRAGTGLGLPIAKNIIDGLGGSLSVDSRPDAGTEIRIELPFTSCPASAGPRGRAGMSGPRGTVLLVDDEEKILKRLGRALRDEGHDVVEAAIGARGAAPAHAAGLRPVRRRQRHARHDRTGAAARRVRVAAREPIGRRS